MTLFDILFEIAISTLLFAFFSPFDAYLSAPGIIHGIGVCAIAKRVREVLLCR